MFTVFATALCVVASVFLFTDLIANLLRQIAEGEASLALIQGTFTVILAIMLFGVFVYLVTRLAQLERHRSHRPPDQASLRAVYRDRAPPSIAVLVPSYKEDVRVIRRTLLSAALLEYPDRRVVLLIDNPPRPASAADRELLRETRELARDLDAAFTSFAAPFQEAERAFRSRWREPMQIERELLTLAGLYEEAADRLRQIGAEIVAADHEDHCFMHKSLHGPAASHRARAAELRQAAAQPPRWPWWSTRLAEEYRRLAALFRVEIDHFERKRFANLSHEPNKAMNLNSYLGIMGRRVCEREGAEGLLLAAGEDGRIVPDAEFVITLDADSVLDPAYALKLVHFMEQPENRRVGVVQTPYAAFPHARRPLERVAGATTDIQYLYHQGFSRFNATFWVGANALLRTRALRDIATTDVERGYPVTRFIQDNTVIEDTESSVDLVARDWRLHNYPERLAWSATPPDFGALLIQRRRWANGGLIILPKFLRYVLRRAPVPHRLGHAVMGWHYLTSLATTNVGLLILLLLPLGMPMRSWWLPVTLLAYFTLYGRDLVRLGYRAREVLDVYALTLLLVPVHVGGVVKSVQQMITGRRTPFGRTPKVQDRTAVPAVYLAGVYGLLGGCLFFMARDLGDGLFLHALFAAVNAGFLSYAVVRFVGLRASIEDLRLAIRALGHARQRAVRLGRPVSA